MLYRKYIKRILDMIIALMGILMLLPLILILALIIKIDSKGPVLFKQIRSGKNRKEFRILKFRTMRVDSPHDMPTQLLKNPDEYITGFGKFLRRTSLDELPQLWNIFIGKMSIIGPRPVIPAEKELLDERDKYNAKSLLPGLTGWAQINGRDILNDSEKARYDGEYIEKCTLSFDVRCFVKTILYVLKRNDVVEGDQVEELRSTRNTSEAVVREVEAKQ